MVWSAVLLGLLGCRGRYVPPTEPMPANTELLSTMMQRLSAQPGFTEALLDRLNKGGKNGAALMTPDLVHRLRELILGKNWEGLNRFPGWTMGEITPTVRVVGRFLPGSEPKTGKEGVSADATPNFSRQPSAAEVARYLTVGSLGLGQAAQVDLDRPAPAAEFQMAQLVEHLGAGVVSGDGPHKVVDISTCIRGSMASSITCSLLLVKKNGSDYLWPTRLC